MLQWFLRLRTKKSIRTYVEADITLDVGLDQKATTVVSFSVYNKKLEAHQGKTYFEEYGK